MSSNRDDIDSSAVIFKKNGGVFMSIKVFGNPVSNHANLVHNYVYAPGLIGKKGRVFFFFFFSFLSPCIYAC